MKLKPYISGLFFLFITFVFSQSEEKKPSIILHTIDSVFVSGTFQTLDFSTSLKLTPTLYISNSFGTTVVEAQRIQKYLFYKIPNNITTKRGLVTWTLIYKKRTLKTGKLKIISDVIVSKIETYVGPPSIEAGGRDFAMSVMIPTDTLDNPVMDNTKVIFKNQFLSRIDTVQLSINNLLSYRNIYSPDKTGRFLISSKCFTKESTEHTLNVWASLPTNFLVFSESNHHFADGNQICKISTSVIKDAYGNIISDGTSVNFIIEDKNGDFLKANGNTINGIATTKLVHPDHQQNWKIKAYVYGMAESNSIKLNFNQVIHTFKVQFTHHNRTIIVGPLQSFMNQMIPDGLRVELDILKHDKTHKYMIGTSKKGYVSFYLDPENYKNETYTFKITTAGVDNIYKNKQVW